MKAIEVVEPDGASGPEGRRNGQRRAKLVVPVISVRDDYVKGVGSAPQEYADQN